MGEIERVVLVAQDRAGDAPVGAAMQQINLAGDGLGAHRRVGRLAEDQPVSVAEQRRIVSPPEAVLAQPGDVAPGLAAAMPGDGDAAHRQTGEPSAQHAHGPRDATTVGHHVEHVRTYSEASA